MTDTITNNGEQSEDGKCGKNCLRCSIDNSCLKCAKGYSIGSKIADRNNNHYLFCDSKTNLIKQNFKLDENGIFYLPFNLIEKDNSDNSKHLNNMSYLFIIKIIFIFLFII